MRDHPAGARLAVALYLHRLRCTACMSQSESGQRVSRSEYQAARWLKADPFCRPWLCPRAVCRCQQTTKCMANLDMQCASEEIDIFVHLNLGHHCPGQHAAVAPPRQRYSLQLHIGQRFSCHSKPLTTDLHLYQI